ncbi:hypothetical protein CASFOL_036906 [Castilleja foliolosa]|uniref:AP2/ERF domain-containing protein n=1 Tax=Castilleja foliolosa TaxID=1961234 RepID=A0ABD3BQD1_9LAMI
MDSPSSNPNQLNFPAECDDEVINLASSHPKKRAGRKKFKETRHPVYRGIRLRKPDKWVCEVREPTKQKRIWLGTYPTAEMAARAHDVAAMALRGQAACLNFADSVWRLTAPVSNDPQDIRKAAAEAAEAFRPEAGEVSVEVGVNNEPAFWDESSYSGGFEMNDPPFWAADGALMSPPRWYEEESMGWGDVASEDEVELWNYSI